MIEILHHADQIGFSFDISTNASLLTEVLVQQLAKLQHLLYIHVSLDGDTQIAQENIRGKKTFIPTIQGMQLLKKY
jgi:sulfatase maturation enzyme AslB (radical SAM superfamily)